MKCAISLQSLAQLTELAETSSSKQTVIKVTALGIDSVGIQSLEAPVSQFGETNGSESLITAKADRGGSSLLQLGEYSLYSDMFRELVIRLPFFIAERQK